MKSIIAAVALFASFAANASGFSFEGAQVGGWTDKDKVKHFVVSAALGGAAGAMMESKTEAFAVAFGIGFAKEVADGMTTKTCRDCGFSVKDLAADAIGAAIGVQVGHGVRVVLKRNGFLLTKEIN